MVGEGELSATDGAFDWIRRMGVHEAYHQAMGNRLLHWVCIPVELLAVVKLFTLVRLVEWVDLALVAIVLIAPIYLATEVLAGALMVLLLLGLRGLAPVLGTGAVGWDALAALVVFAVAFTVQTQVGHRVFQRGLDDTGQNLAELRRTKNPVPILLVFHYHLVELLLAVGYRPGLRQAIAAHTRAELERIATARSSGASSQSL